MSDEKKIDGNEAAFGHGAENGHCCGLTIRDYLIAKFEAAWIGALMERYQSTPVLIMKDAHNFAIQQADNFIAEKRRSEK